MASLQLGVVSRLPEGPKEALRKVASIGFPTTQLICWDPGWFTVEMAERVVNAVEETRVAISTLWVGTPGKYVWDFLQGPSTIGIVPEATRAERVEVLKKGSDFAKMIGVSSITTHVGFIPDDPATAQYRGVIDALKAVVERCGMNGQGFWFETGQETPVTLLRTIEDIGTDNLGVNLDPANLLMYGKANPVDALDVFGQYVRGVHAKDGEYPTNGRDLGVEKPLGEGRVGFPALIRKLVALGFDGALTIEREISGPQQILDIAKGKAFLESILESL